MKAIVAYIPVWCTGYSKFLATHSDAQRIIILGQTVTHKFRPLQKDLRALDPYEVQKLLKWKRICKDVCVLEEGNKTFLENVTEVVMLDEDISYTLSAKFPQHIRVLYDTSHFLRWDSKNSKKSIIVKSARVIPADGFLQSLNLQLAKEANRSPDLWRQIAGAIFDEQNRVLLVRHNICVPTTNQLNFFGDPRGQFKKGENVDLSIFLHVEAGLIAEAARIGLSLEGKSMYVSTFPCPPCGKSVAFSGIKKLYFKEGYAMLDSEEILLSQGIEILQVQF